MAVQWQVIAKTPASVPAELTADQLDALNNANGPDAAHPYLTAFDFDPANGPTPDEKAAMDGAAAPDAGNVFATMDDLPSGGLVVLEGAGPPGPGEDAEFLFGSDDTGGTGTILLDGDESDPLDPTADDATNQAAVIAANPGRLTGKVTLTAVSPPLAVWTLVVDKSVAPVVLAIGNDSYTGGSAPPQVISDSGGSAPQSGVNGQIYIDTDTSPGQAYMMVASVWVGLTILTRDLPAGTHKITDLAPGTDPNDAAKLSQASPTSMEGAAAAGAYGGSVNAQDAPGTGDGGNAIAASGQGASGKSGGNVVLMGASGNAGGSGGSNIFAKGGNPSGTGRADIELHLGDNANAMGAVNLFWASAAPNTGGGILAGVASICFRSNGGVGELWLKTGAGNTAWTKIL